jgi:hypothetical protein
LWNSRNAIGGFDFDAFHPSAWRIANGSAQPARQALHDRCERAVEQARHDEQLPASKGAEKSIPTSSAPSQSQRGIELRSTPGTS